MANKYCSKPSQWPVSHQHVGAECAALQAQTYLLNKSAVHLRDGSLANLKHIAVDELNTTSTADFFTSFPMMHALQILADSVPSDLRKEIELFAEKAFKPANPTLPVPCNQV
jgi:hypothetical protein